MTVSTRHFLVSGDEIRPLPQSLNDRLRRGDTSLPGYAGQELHVADVTVEIRDRAAVKIRDIHTAILSLDDRGALRSRLLDELRASLSESRTGRLPRHATWSPSKAQLDRITELALGRTKSKLKPPRASAAAAAPRGEPQRHASGRRVATAKSRE